MRITPPPPKLSQRLAWMRQRQGLLYVPDVLPEPDPEASSAFEAELLDALTRPLTAANDVHDEKGRFGTKDGGGAASPDTTPASESPAISPLVWDGKYKAESGFTGKDGREYKLKYDALDGIGSANEVQAFRGKASVGYLDWYGGQPRHDGSNIDGGVIAGVNVKESDQRNGVASAMLDFAREVQPDKDIRHSGALTEDGKAWSGAKASLARRPSLRSRLQNLRADGGGEFDEAKHPRDERGRFGARNNGNETPPGYQPDHKFPNGEFASDAYLKSVFGFSTKDDLNPPDEKNPRSGWPMKVGVHLEEYMPPEDPNDHTFGGTGAPLFAVKDYGDGHLMPGMIQASDPVPITQAFRAMTTEDWDKAQQTGFIKSDMRGAISQSEGTNAGVDPRTAMSYLPYGGTPGVIVGMKVDPADGWFTARVDSYLRTTQPIPLDRVFAVTAPMMRTGKYDTLQIPDAAVQADGFDEAQHPRDERGRFGSANSGTGETEQAPAAAAWKPEMTSAEADAWSANSVIKDNWVHNTPNAESIRAQGFQSSESGALGPGVYAAETKFMASGYSGEPLTVRMNVQNPTDLEQFAKETGWSGKQSELPGLVSQAQQQGYDAFRWGHDDKEDYWMNEIVVFDPHNITVVSDATTASALTAADRIYERDERGRFGTTGGASATPAPASEPDTSGVIDTLKAQGGFTWDPSTGSYPSTGYIVATDNKFSGISKDDILGDTAVAEAALTDWIMAHQEQLSQPGMMVGGWHDTEHGEVVFDVVEKFDDKEQALQAGRDRDQQSIFHLDSMETIPTGGTGGRPAEPTTTASAEPAWPFSARTRGPARGAQDHAGRSSGDSQAHDLQAPGAVASRSGATLRLKRRLRRLS